MLITLDLETTGLDPFSDKILLNGYRLDGKGEVIYARTDRRDDILYDLLNSPDNILTGWNIKFDALFLYNAGYSLQCALEDSKVMAYCCWPTEESYALKDMVEVKLKTRPVRLDDLLFKPTKIDKPYMEEYAQYYSSVAGKSVRNDYFKAYHKEDVYNVDRIRALMHPPEWFYKVEKPLTKILFEAEAHGFPLDLHHLEKINEDFSQKANESLCKVTERGQFNPGSKDQLTKEYKERGFDLDRLAEKTPTGDYKLDKTFLKKLAWKGDEFSKNLLEYRKFQKLLSTYIEPFTIGARRDGRIHGSFNQCGSEDVYGDGGRPTYTGRLSSSNPNLQNIPSRTKEGREVRKAFVATPGMLMFFSDKSQVEPRFVAHYSQSRKLLDAYRDGIDTHGMFACDIFGISSIQALSVLQRFIGKSSWLATVYGCGYKKLLYICENFSDSPLQLDLGPYLRLFDLLPQKAKWGDSQEKLRKMYRDQAEEVYAKWMFFKNVQEAFKKKNPEIFNWREGHIGLVRKLGYVTTYGGRRIQIDGLDAPEKFVRFAAERKAINYQIQGSSADAIKLSMLEIDTRLTQKKLGRIFAQVHDEVDGEIKDPEYLWIVKDAMENTCKLNNVQLKSDTKLINSWGDKG